ncbi:MAG: hypothetical protein OXI38_00455 [Bacteroidota bacterium]|nr:hypothetical protein [Bacteroidota bacterium]
MSHRFDGALSYSSHSSPCSCTKTGAQSYQIRNRLIGRFRHLLEPVRRPLGFGWKISADLVTAFAAREVIMSPMGLIYSDGDGGDSVALRDALKAEWHPIFTPLVAMSLLVFSLRSSA